MTKKSTKTVHFGNPNPLALPRNKDGQFCKLAGSLTKTKQYTTKRKRSILCSIPPREHQFCRLIADALGISLQALATSSLLMHAQQLAQELAIKSGKVTE